VELYLEGGVRTVEIGSVMLSFISPDTGELVTPPLELIRLAIPRRTYTESHLQHVVDSFKAVVERKESLKGLKITKQPLLLRHFTCDFDWVENAEIKENVEAASSLLS